MADSERRTTRQRRAVETVLRGRSDFASAQDLHAALRANGEGIGLATVYRALSTLVQDDRLDVLRSPDGEARYRLCESSGHHHHLVCRRCGRTVEIAGAAVEEWAGTVAGAHGFRDVSHTLELFGLCGGCSGP